MGLLLGPPTAPDLLMSDDGRVLGLRNEKGVVHRIIRHVAAVERPDRCQAQARQCARGP
jgi:hypothetical protein